MTIERMPADFVLPEYGPEGSHPDAAAEAHKIEDNEPLKRALNEVEQLVRGGLVPGSKSDA